ncbi:hypothetical protein [Phenylobacterium aquaticum]|nr:hypothetical protein [Phenylobacterium aquaticum]MCI3132108.1 hypothetical protein [Phenylobacterium aquaticum]
MANSGTAWLAGAARKAISLSLAGLLVGGPALAQTPAARPPSGRTSC